MNFYTALKYVAVNPLFIFVAKRYAASACVFCKTAEPFYYFVFVIAGILILRYVERKQAYVACSQNFSRFKGSAEFLCVRLEIVLFNIDFTYR